MEKITIYIVTIEWQCWNSFAKSIPFRTKEAAVECALKWAADFEDERGDCVKKVEDNGCHVNVYDDDYYMVADVNEFNL